MKEVIIVLFAVLLVSCSSPERGGKEAATRVNLSAKQCLESLQRLESDFVADFNPDNYSFRSEAIEEYRKEFKRIAEEYHHNLDEVSILKSRLKSNHSNDYEEMVRFEDAYSSELDEGLYLKADQLISSDVIPAAVKSVINKIIPPKPNEERILSDLKGHSLREGFDRKECYFSEEWVRIIGDNVSIQEFHLDEIQKEDSREYSFTSSMVLKEEYLSYNARALVYYILPDGEDWKIDFVKSLGVRVVQTHKFDDCIRCEIQNDSGLLALFITNISEVKLLVIGDVMTDDGKIQFSKVIPAGEKVQVGGLFYFLASVNSYSIAAVERI